MITFIAEPTLTQAKTWEELQLMRNTVQRQLMRQRLLFYLYLVALGLALLVFLIPNSYSQILHVAHVGFLALSVFLFLASFGLPGSLMKIQQSRYELVLKDKRPAAVNEALDTQRRKD